MGSAVGLTPGSTTRAQLDTIRLLQVQAWRWRGGSLEKRRDASGKNAPIFSEICGGLCGFLQTLLHEPKRHLSPGNRFEDPGMRTDLRGVSGSSPRRSLLQVHLPLQ